MNPSRPSLPPAPLGRAGVFHERALEREFGVGRWPQDAARMRFVCLLTGAAELLAVGVDVAHFAGWALALMAAGRLATLVLAGLAVRLTRRPERPGGFSRMLTAYMLAAGGLESLELCLLSSASATSSPLTVIMVLMFYLFLPPRLATAVTAGLVTTVLYLLTLVLATPVPAADVYTQALFFGLANGFGAYFLVRYGRSLRREYWMRRELIRVNEALLRQVSATAEANRRLAELASTDPLTGAMNRRRFFEALETEFGRVRRYGGELSVVMFDLDHFKDVNDRFGHAAGDAVLVRMAELCRVNRRAADVFGRLGGEEFALLLPETGPAQAAAVAERIRCTVAAQALEASEGEVRITLSAGVAAYDPADPDGEALLRRADAALYEAKRQGRDRVCCPGADTAPAGPDSGTDSGRG
ncbi:MAG: GGDEF domain-containing protein [Desulfovibrionaceae bacterium]